MASYFTIGHWASRLPCDCFNCVGDVGWAVARQCLRKWKFVVHNWATSAKCAGCVVPDAQISFAVHTQFKWGARII